MRANESRPTREAASKAGGPEVRVRLALDLRDIDMTHGWPTFEGARRAHARLDEALAAPRGVELVLRVGSIRPGMAIPEAVWHVLLERFEVTIEAETPWVARDWHEFANAVLGGGVNG